jgi:hypothetical protein
MEHVNGNVTNELFVSGSIFRSIWRYGLFAGASHNGVITTSLNDKFGWFAHVIGPPSDAVAMSDRYIFTGTQETPGRAVIYEATNFREPVERGSISWSAFGAYRVTSMSASPTLLVAAGNNS